MQNKGLSSHFGLENHGLHHLKTIYWNLSPAALVEQALLRQEGELTASGALLVNTGKYTGRSPNDKYIAITPNLVGQPMGWGKINQPIAPDRLWQIFQKMRAYLQGREVFVQDMLVGAHPDYQYGIRVISEQAWASLFSHNLFRRPSPQQAEQLVPQYTVLHCPQFQAMPEEDGTHSSTIIGIDFERRLVLIGGTSYAGEIKKTVFSVMNYEYPQNNVLPMHCSANVSPQGAVALFFGLSGTGKTTLSSDPDRMLIGDDEHGWSQDGVFNLEGGCYAKTIHLRQDLEPLIWNAAQQFGTVLENVVYHPDTRQPDFDDDHRTENTRAAYPIEAIPNYVVEGFAGHPTQIFFLTADAFGVLPPIARLSSEQALYYFLSGYTSKLAGTEKGLGKEPQATFSECFAAPFLPLQPEVYARLLGERIQRHQVQVWLINTGWSGGPYSIGKRMPLPYTRAMVRAALNHTLDNVSYTQDTSFGLWIPETCPDVPAELLNPITTWGSQAHYFAQASALIERFERNFDAYRSSMPESIAQAGPHLS